MFSRKKMLITGISGLLGNNLGWYFKEYYEVLGVYNNHPVNIQGVNCEPCDISDSNQIDEIVQDFKPNIIVHCASLTNVDKCESERDQTHRINVHGTKNIVNCVKDQDTYLVYISTDSVYEGIQGNSKEKDPIKPENYYGLTKYQGEREVLKAEKALVLRTNIFGWNLRKKESLAEWILYALKNGRNINGFTDAYFSTIYTMELARIIDLAIKNQLTGVFNCGSADSCSKYEFALKIAHLFGLDQGLIKPMSVDEFDFIAPRGKKLSLDVSKIEQSLKYRLPTIDFSLECFYRDYQIGLPKQIKKVTQEKKPYESNVIPYGRQYIDKQDVQSVVNILQSERITQGPMIEIFEEELAKVCNAKYAVAINSGTSGLHIACLAAGVDKGDEVITSAITFVASANCIAYCGGIPVFADIDTRTYNISPQEIERKINCRTKAIIPVHFAGQSCDMEAIARIVKKAEKKYGHRIYIIEDGCHALGSFYKNHAVGSCEFSNMAVTSFHPVKHITTGEGGAVFTNDKEILRRLKLFRSHGITNEPSEFKFQKGAYEISDICDEEVLKPWYYEQIKLGYNYRITDIQCALGYSQLSKLRFFVRKRRNIVNAYNIAFKDVNQIKIPTETEVNNSNFHLYVLLISFERIGKTRSRVIKELRERQIMTQVHYIPVHTQPFYQERYNTRWGDCPIAERYYQRCLSIPLYPAMTQKEIACVVDAVKSVAVEH